MPRRRYLSPPPLCRSLTDSHSDSAASLRRYEKISCNNFDNRDERPRAQGKGKAGRQHFPEPVSLWQKKKKSATIGAIVFLSLLFPYCYCGWNVCVRAAREKGGEERGGFIVLFAYFACLSFSGLSPSASKELFRSGKAFNLPTAPEKQNATI